jgi:hypothetical protein
MSITRRALCAALPPVLAGCVTAHDQLARADADWSPTIGSFEHHDSARTSYFPEFEAFPGPRSETSVQPLSDLPGLWNAAFSSNERGFALHGVIGGVEAAGPPSVTMFNPSTMEPLKRVTLAEPMADDWVYPGGVAVHGSGYAFAVTGTRLVKIRSSTGDVVSNLDLPAPAGRNMTAYNGFVAARDGAIILKSHHRKLDCPSQGYRALIECGVDGLPSSTLVTVDPSSNQILWQGVAPEFVGGRVSCISWRGREYVYLAGADAVHRLVYSRGGLRQDHAWGPAGYRSPSATPGTAVVGFGDYVVVQDNAIPTRAPLSVSIISQADSETRWRLTPFDDGGEFSFMPSKPTVDVSRSRIYVGDAHAGIAAIDFDPVQGPRVAWRRPYRTGSFLTLCGERRVLVVSDIGRPRYDDYGAPIHTQETCRWLDAASGGDLAEIAGLPRNFGLTITPGPGGAIYFATRTQGLYRLAPSLTS